jgi:ABC-type transport system involved in multi-copper enzyme maturation permease subunit
MSTATTYDAGPHVAGPGRDASPGLARLTRVELRKMYDTRAGFWLLLSGLALTALVAALIVFTSGGDKDFGTVLDGSVQAINVLVPVVGILLVTSEWSQRTAQVTFTLVPQRGRVLAAKLCASVVLALAAFVITLGVSALFTALGGEPTADAGVWSLDGGVLVQTIVFTIISMLGGVAFGAAILLSAPAIVASFVLPLAVTAITHIIGGLEGLAQWIDPSETYSALTDHSLSGHEWAQLGTTLLLWVALPLTIGTYRFLRDEVR